MYDQMSIKNMFELKETIASPLFEKVDYPWEVLPYIEDFIIALGENLPESEYVKKGTNIWIAKSAKIASTAAINGPVIIGKDAEIRHCAFIRGKAIIGEGTVVGNSTELKNVILFNKVQVPHYNYVGDSILGYKAHFGAGSITSNIKSDRTPIVIRYNGSRVETGMIKIGAMVGDNVEVGCNAVLNPGTVIGRNTSIYPLSTVRGFVPAQRIFKSQNDIVFKKEQD